MNAAPKWLTLIPAALLAQATNGDPQDGRDAALALITCHDASQTWFDAATKAGRWIRSHEIEDERGLAWPADPENDATVVDHLYSGNAGVVLFLLQLGEVTGDESWTTAAQRGADRLIAKLPEQLQPGGAGLYTGVAGIGYALNEVYRTTREARFRDAALRCVQLIHDAARPAGAGVEWGPVTDIIAGSAGTGLFLLYAADEMAHTPSRELAARAGERLLQLGVAAEGGLKWRMTPDFERLMPNFSHGTAGVAFFLARLYEETARQEFLDGAIRGARYLQTIADTDDGACLIMHHEPGGEDLYYLSWCHGPAGTGRLFQQLYAVTRDPEWREWTIKCADALLKSGIPEQQTPGFWNNVGVCCGSAGVAQFMIDLHQETGDDTYLPFAQRLMFNAVERAAADEGAGAMKWVHAEHRTRPDFLVAQTGYMQGAAGIGTTLLKLAAFEREKPWDLNLPDEPTLERIIKPKE